MEGEVERWFRNPFRFAHEATMAGWSADGVTNSRYPAWAAMILVCGACSVPASTAGALEHVGTAANYTGILRQLKPGDRLELSAGVYREGLPISDLHGAPGRPIVIEGPTNGAPPCCWPARDTIP